MAEITQPGPNRVSLTHIIELGVQKTYHDLTVLAELLPRKTDFERKVEIVNFAERTRQLFIRLLALVKWAGGASKIEQCMDIVSFLDKQALLFTNTADNMVKIARTTLVQARLPSFQLPCAVEVLTLGTYSRMPTCVRDRIVPPDSITLDEKRATLARLDYIIEQRLSTSSIHPSMRDLKVEFGRVTFHVENEFDLKLTCLGDSPSLPWHVLGLDLLVEDANAGEGRDLVHPHQLRLMERMVQQKMSESQTPLVDVFAKLHNFCLSLQVEVLHSQTEKLIRDRLGTFIKIDSHIPGQKLVISYWGGENSLMIQTDQTDLCKPLKLTHHPDLTLDNGVVNQECNYAPRPGNVSVEQLITDTIQKRAHIKLSQLANYLRAESYGRCAISGSPTTLHVCCLDPCTTSEELIISIHLDGSYKAYMPQYGKSCLLAEDIQKSLNSNRSKLGTYFDQLKIWLSKKRCLRTIDYLSVTATETLPLCSKANHARLDDKVSRLFFQFNKYNHYYLMAEFRTLESDPFKPEIRYSLLVTEPAPTQSSDGLDNLETADTSMESVHRNLIVLENILRLDVDSIIATNYCYESVAQDKFIAYNNPNAFIKKETKRQMSDAHSDEPISIDNEIHSHVGRRPPVSLINVLPQLVSFCEEKLAHAALEKELRTRNISYEVSHSETSGYAYCITFKKIPSLRGSTYSNALLKDTCVMTLCLHEKPQSSKIWHCSYIFRNCPIKTQSAKEQSPRRFVFTPYESPLLNSGMVSKFIDDTHLDWTCMAHLYDVVKDFSRDIQRDPTLLDTIVLKSFNYKKLVIIYGPQRNYSVTLLWRPSDRKFHLIFSVIGGAPFNLNPHSCMSTHYKHEFNQHKSIETLVTSLNSTLEALTILQTLPVYSFLGFTTGRPTTPSISFCLIPLSTHRVKLVYRNWHSIDIKIQLDGTLTIRDGSCSKFDKSRLVEEMNQIVNFEHLLGRSRVSNSYTLKMDEFRRIFCSAHLEQNLGMSFMIKNIYKKLTMPGSTATVRAISPTNDPNVMSIASEQLQYRFSLDRNCGVQMKVTPITQDWTREDIEVLERHFETRVACYPFKADLFTSFYRLLFSFRRDLLKDFIQILKMELFPERLEPNILWNITFYNLVPSGTPFMSPGMSAVCPLKSVVLFILQLTKRSNVMDPSAPSLYLPFSYDNSQNNLAVYIPPRQENVASASLPYLIGIDGFLKRFCERERGMGDQSCLVYRAIRQLVTYPNLTNLYAA